MIKNKNRALSVITAVAVTVCSLFPALFNMNTTAFGSGFYVLSGVESGKQPKESPWYFNAADYSDKTPSSTPLPSDFTKPITKVPDSVKTLRMPEITVSDDESTVNVKFDYMSTADQRTVNLYSVSGGEYTLIKSEVCSVPEFDFTGLASGERYAVQAIFKYGDKLIGVTDTAEFNAVYEETSNLKLANSADSNDKLISVRDGSMDSFGSIDLTDSPTGKAFALKYKLKANGKGYADQAIAFDVTVSLDTSVLPEYGATALAFWMDASDADKGSLKDNTSLRDISLKSSTDSTKSLKLFDYTKSTSFYLLSYDGTLKTVASTTGNGFFPPHGFKGWILLPVNTAVDYSKYDRLYIKRNPNKVITFNADAPSRTLYLSSFGILTGTQPENVTPNDLIIPDDSRKTDLKAIAVTADTLSSCSEFNSADNTLASPFGVKYTFHNTESKRELTAYLKDNGTNLYGTALEFRSPDTAYYDFASAFRVINNDSGSGTLYYRVAKYDADKNKTGVWPAGGGRYTLRVTDDTPNPAATLSPVEIYLVEDESLVLEVYFKSSDPAGGDIEVSLGSPTLTRVDKATDSKGYSASYAPAVYHAYNRTDGKGYTAVADRFEFNVMKLETDGVVTAPVTNYIPAWSNAVNNSAYNNAGYQYNNGILKATMRKNCGISLDFMSPESGNAVLVSNSTDNKNVFTRILKNGEQIYPENGWAQFDKASTFMATESLEAGDRLTLQMYSSADKETLVSLPALKINITGGNQNNLPTDSIFSALLERPYGNSDYIGGYVPSKNAVWQFSVISGETGLTPVSCDSFDSEKERYLYHSSNASVGYHFTQNDLIFDGTSATNGSLPDGSGLSLRFTVPASSIYDFSCAARLLSGDAELKLRMTKNGEALYPLTGGWANASDTADSFPAFEFAALEGDVIAIEAVAVSNGGLNAVRIGLGTPVLRKISPKIPQPQGYSSVYSPADYLPALDSGYCGAAVYATQRFEFALYSGDKIINSEFYDSAAGFLGSADGRFGFTVSQNGVKAKISKEYGGALIFTAAADGYASLNCAPKSTDGKMRVLLNGKAVWPDNGEWQKSPENGIEINNIRMLKGQRLALEICTDETEKTLNIGLPFVTFVSDHSNSALPGSDSYYALYSDPYAGTSYTGAYKPIDGLWNFETLENSTGKSVITDTYKSGTENQLYNSVNKAGYIFSESSLQARLTPKAGVSLRFVSPEDAVYDWQGGVTLSSAGTAEISARILKNGAPLWPEDGTPYKKVLSQGESLELPVFEADCAAGDRISVEISAHGTEDSVTVDLGSPAMIKTRSSVITTPDASGRVYASQNYNPFGNTAYSGEYVPVEGRWNYELLNISEDHKEFTTVKPNRYNGTNKLIQSTEAGGAGFYVGVMNGNKLSVGASDIYCKNGKSYGTALRFVSPISGEALITGSPYVNSASSMAEDTTVYFRLLVNGKTVFPENGEWAEMTDKNRNAGFGGYTANLSIGDEVIWQTWFTSKTNTSLSVMVNSPSVVAVTSQQRVKDTYNVRSDFTPYYQISPFWNYEYSLKRDNPEYKLLNSYTGTAWQYDLPKVTLDDGSTKSQMLGATTGSTAGSGHLWINSTANGGEPGAAAFSFTAPKDGWYSLSNIEASTNYRDGDMLARITLNGEQIWPNTKNWQDVRYKASAKVAIEEDGLSLKAGDVLRFEGSIADGAISSYNDSKVIWRLIMHYSESKPNSDKNRISLFCDLTDEETDYFNSIKTEKQFDINYGNAKERSESFMTQLKKELAYWKYLHSENQTANDNSTAGTGGTPGTDGYWVPGTDDVVKKTIKKYIITSGLDAWDVVLIACGSLILAGGAAAFIIIKNKKAKPAAEQAIPSETSDRINDENN